MTKIKTINAIKNTTKTTNKPTNINPSTSKSKPKKHRCRIPIIESPSHSHHPSPKNKTPKKGDMLPVSCVCNELSPSIRSNYRAAGILPISMNIRKESFVLIGQEIRGKMHVWSEFGGKIEKEDKTVEETALREFMEETEYCFVKDRQNFLKHISSTCSTSHCDYIWNKKGKYVMIIMRIPAITPSIPSNPLIKKEIIDDNNPTNPTKPTNPTNDGSLEKCAFCWIKTKKLCEWIDETPKKRKHLQGFSHIEDQVPTHTINFYNFFKSSMNISGVSKMLKKYI